MNRDVGVIYPTFNRLDYVKMTLPLLVHECMRSERFNELLIIDDASTDGTWEFIKSLNLPQFMEGRVRLLRDRIGNSWSQWNISSKIFHEDVKFILNLTNEPLVPMGIIDELASKMEGTTFAVGPQLVGGNPFPECIDYNEQILQDVPYIGCGMINREIFQQEGDIKGGDGDRKYFGFTAYQNKIKKAGYGIYLHKGVEVVQLDRSPVWSRAAEYHQKGWCRLLNCNDESPFNVSKECELS